MGVDNGGSFYQQALEDRVDTLKAELELVMRERDEMSLALERIARGAESNPLHEIAEIAWKALRAE